MSRLKTITTNTDRRKRGSRTMLVPYSQGAAKMSESPEVKPAKVRRAAQNLS